MSAQSTTSGSTSSGHEFRRAYRDSQQPVLGGVAAGLARHLGVPVLWVRVAFVVAAALGGMGVVLYGAFWMILPSDSRFEEAAPGLESATRTGKRPGRVARLTDLGPVVAVGALAVGLLLLLGALLGTGAFFWPVVLGAAGVTLLWRQADEVQRERWLDSSGRIDPFRALFGAGGWASYARVAAGAVLVLGALVVFSLRAGDLGAARDITVAGLLGIVGLAIVVGPWIYRLAADLTAERAERVRTQERADLAAHLHDSVLQTLALIQKNADDAPLVARLARSQERDLRAWLYDDRAGDDTTFASTLRTLAGQVEDAHGVSVDLVIVGDCSLTDPVRALVSATGEAVTNAAKHAGTGRVDVYAEVSAALVEVFVRDRGVGFDPAAVPEGRYGVRHSIVDRMERHGGTAEIRSATGEGTEVRLHMPRQEENHG
ncbi:MAG TPA: PspC domain-containing protein [Nocardioides sp.]|uniref:ATP-binding protein n=1 Tax=Nocardioides sp. TaxID=35761 RepID=UPI002BDFCA27|nr:PspC domain-containing protein [Nocardioides sp.]HQR27649.1 PspC domain-containing protein [Nocardioides sp.]